MCFVRFLHTMYYSIDDNRQLSDPKLLRREAKAILDIL